jgi:hypothetical protein
MPKDLPKDLEYFLKNALSDMEDGFEYASELNRILNSDTSQLLLKPEEIQKLRNFAEKIKKFGEINYYTENKVKELEIEMFGTQGIDGYLKIKDSKNKSNSIDDLFNF